MHSPLLSGPGWKKNQPCICIKYSSTCTSKPPSRQLPLLHFRDGFLGLHERRSLLTLFWAHLDENLCWLYFPRQQNTGKTRLHSIFWIRNKTVSIFCVTQKRWHHILEEKLSLLIVTASHEILIKSDLDSSQLPLKLKSYWDFGFGHLKHLYREQEGIIRGLFRAGVGRATPFIES